MNKKEEAAYVDGTRAANLSMLRYVLRELGYSDSMKAEKAIAHLEETRQALRALCRKLPYGANNWHEDLHLADVVEKYVGQAILPFLPPKSGEDEK